MTYREARTLEYKQEIKIKNSAYYEPGEIVRVCEVKFGFSGRTPYAVVNVNRKRDGKNLDYWYDNSQLEFIKNE